jgi:4-hydroxybenzoate polyprenyltransferase
VIDRIRLTVLMARPAVLVLLAMFTSTGLAQAGHAGDTWLLAHALIVVAGFVVFSVACNDLADVAVDRVNLAGDPRRPLAAGTASRREFVVTGAVAAAVALGASATLRWPALAVTAAGLTLSAGYSLRPVRVADRGALASLLLPACYVAVPYLVGIFAARGTVRGADLLLLGGLYVGFIGRILLKDFRDVRGDALFGKRTFLVRHGRRWTCLVSAACWIAGAVVLLAAVRHPTVSLVATYAVCVGTALGLLRALSVDRGPRRDERLVSGTAIVGRGMILTLLAYLTMTEARWPAAAQHAVLAALAVLALGQAYTMLRHGPVARVHSVSTVVRVHSGANGLIGEPGSRGAGGPQSSAGPMPDRSSSGNTEPKSHPRQRAHTCRGGKATGRSTQAPFPCSASQISSGHNRPLIVSAAAQPDRALTRSPGQIRLFEQACCVGLGRRSGSGPGCSGPSTGLAGLPMACGWAGSLTWCRSTGRREAGR